MVSLCGLEGLGFKVQGVHGRPPAPVVVKGFRLTVKCCSKRASMLREVALLALNPKT